ncbi:MULTISPECIES: DUF4393 domain-containing protein [unclassified Curtobacterium]|uniref:DUF4393 domain-containing protein n=1 Tax=unclassified Curtobacterium TaxID=257496 RepID=UPI0011B4BB1E|nr:MULTISPECIES: DUF4393 domain-containing protein [unclassified Curtobacterium]
MVEPGAVAGAVARATDEAAAEGAKVAGNLLTRLLGPSADVVGADWAEKLRRHNLERLLKKTQTHADRDGASEPGFATPRLAASTFEVAQYADEEIISEYLSGVLSSSRNPTGGNDSGIPWSAIISRMSSDQLKLHYLIYSSCREDLIQLGKDKANQLHQTDILLATEDVFARLELNRANFYRLSDAIDGLMREGLIDSTFGYAFGPIAVLAEQQRKYGNSLAADFASGIRLSISIHGIRLFLWGLGRGDGLVDQYIDKNVALAPADAQPNLLPVRGGAYANYWT